MDAALARAVRIRAHDRCEYCHAPQAAYRHTLQIDHIIAEQHGGKSVSDNLALCCLDCNLRKGPNIAGIDADTQMMTPLFNPRKDRWPDHFALRGAAIVGLTPIGRASVAVLGLNRPARVMVRQSLIEEGWFVGHGEPGPTED